MRHLPALPFQRKKMKKMGFNRLNRYTVFLTAALVVGLCVTIFFSYQAWSMGECPGGQSVERKKSGSGWCPETGLYLKMEDTLLYIPPELTKGSSFSNNRAAPEKPFCYQRGEAPIEITSLWLFPSAYFVDYNPDKPLARQGRSLVLKVYSSNVERKDLFVRDIFHKLNLESLPIEEGFHIYHSDVDRPWLRFYISDPKVLTTPGGNPVVFSCATNTVHGLCSTSLAIGKLRFTLTQIKPEYIPVDEWPLLYKHFAALVDSLIIHAPSARPDPMRILCKGRNRRP